MLSFEFEQMFTSEHKSFPDWSRLTNFVKVEEVMVLHPGNIQFVFMIQADCFKISPAIVLPFTDLGPLGPLAISRLERTGIATWFRSFKKFVLLEEVPDLMNEKSQRIKRFFQDLGCRDVSSESFPDNLRDSWKTIGFRTPILSFEHLSLEFNTNDNSDSEASD